MALREIIFRGKLTDSDEWVYGDIAHHDGVISYIGQHPVDGSMLCYDLIPETVGQFTGLKDKNGNKIFEGDIVNVNTNKDTFYHIYQGRNLVIRFDEYHRFVASGRLEYPLCNHYEWEVIGNVWDSKEA